MFAVNSCTKPDLLLIKNASMLGGISGTTVGLFERLSEVQLPRKSNLNQILSGAQTPTVPLKPFGQLSGRVFVSTFRGTIIGATFSGLYCYFQSLSLEPVYSSFGGGFVASFVGASLWTQPLLRRFGYGLFFGLFASATTYYFSPGSVSLKSLRKDQ